MTRQTLRASLLAALALGALGASAWATRLKGPKLPLFARGGAAPVNTGPTPAGLDGVDAARCGKCHAEIVAEWRGSMHAKAWEDPVFQEAYLVEPLAECRNCHAPENGGGEPTGRAAAEGVSCAVCHVREGKVLAGHGARSGPHVLYATRHLDSSAMCAGCHQFNFLGFVSGGSAGAGHHVETDEVQQDTFGEWETSRSRTAKETCQDCHMPWKTGASGRSYRSHAFPGGFDDALVKEADRKSVV